MAKISPEMQDEMSRLRGSGLSLQEVAMKINEKFGLNITHQTVSYQLQKRKENTLNHNKPIRIINYQQIQLTSNKVNLSNHEFEKNRNSDFVYQKGRDVHEIRSDCVHSTTMILPNKSADQSYSLWSEIYSRDIDIAMLDHYENYKKNSDAFYSQIQAQKIEQLWRNFGRNITEKRLGIRLSQNIFQNAQFSEKVRTQFLEGVRNENLVEELQGNEPEQLISLSNQYKSSNELIASFENRESKSLHELFSNAFCDVFDSLGIPEKWKDLSLETGCLDTGKLNVFKIGKFQEWSEYEIAYEAGFKKSADWIDSKSKNCKTFDEYVIVTKNGWNRFEELEHARSFGIPDANSHHYYALRDHGKLEQSFVDELNFDSKNDNLREIILFDCGKEIDLWKKICTDYFQSSVVIIPKLIEAYNQSQSSGRNITNEEQLKQILSKNPFSECCKVKLEAGIVEISSDKQTSEKSGQVNAADSDNVELDNVRITPVSKNEKKKLPFDISVMKFLLESNSAEAKKMIRRLESNDLEDSIDEAWKWVAFNTPGDIDSTDTRRNEKICEYIIQKLSLNNSEKNLLHTLRMLRNDIQHPTRKKCKDKPDWKYVIFGLEVVERLVTIDDVIIETNEDLESLVYSKDLELYDLRKKLERLENDFQNGKFTGRNEKKFFEQARLIQRAKNDRKRYLNETYVNGFKDVHEAIREYLGREPTLGEILPKCPACSRLLHPEESIDECDWCGHTLTDEEKDYFS